VVETGATCVRDETLLVANGPRCRPKDCRAITLRRGILWIVVFVLCSMSSALGIAQEVTSAQMQSLDEQVQEIKTDVLSIAAELSRLEETLLYPSNTQVAVFVSFAKNDESRLDSVQIQIDGELVAHHIYSFKELEALRKGGVQRIFTGNLRTGEHRLDVSVSGKLSGGKDFSGTETFSFTKEVEPKIVGITLDANEFGKPRIQLGAR